MCETVSILPFSDLASALTPTDPPEHGVRETPPCRGGQVPKQLPSIHG